MVRIIGTDVPDYATKFMRDAYASQAKTLDSAAASVQAQAQMSAGITNDLAQANQTIAQAQAQSGANAGQGAAMLSTQLGALNQGIANVYQASIENKKIDAYTKAQQAKAQEELLKKLKEDAGARQHTAAFDELSQVKAKAHTYFYSKDGGGYPQYRSDIEKIISKYEFLTPQAIRELLGDAYSVSEQIQKQQFTRTQDEVEKLDNINRDSSLQELRLRMQKITASISASSGDITPYIEQFNEVTKEYFRDKPDLDVLDIAYVRNGVLKTLADSVGMHADKAAQVQQQIAATDKFISEVSPAVAEYRAGLISPQEYQSRLYKAQLNSGLAPTVANSIAGNPFQAEADLNNLVTSQERLRKLQEDNLANDLSSIEINSAWIGDQSWRIITNPDLEAVYSSKPYSDYPQYKRVMAVVGIYREYERERKTIQASITDLVLQKQTIAAATLQGLIRTGSSPNEWVAKILGQPIDNSRDIKTEQDWVNVRNDIMRTIDTKIAQQNATLAEYQMKLKPYGLENGQQSIELMRQKNRADIDSINQLWQQKQQSQPQTSGGLIPNFNGGSPVPLKKVAYREKNIALPFLSDAKVTITSHFNDARPGHRDKYKKHHGIDFGAAIGTPIVVPENGTVLHAGTYDGYGYTVDIRTASGKVLRFAHNSTNLVKTGQSVQAGQVIAKVGDTGNARGKPHLHFEVLHNQGFNYENATDPAVYLQQINQNQPLPRGNSYATPKIDTVTGRDIAPRVPASAVPFNGGYIQNGKSYTNDGTPVPTPNTLPSHGQRNKIKGFAPPTVTLSINPANYGERFPTDKKNIVVLHSSDGSVEQTINWFNNPKSESSYHVLIGRDGTVHYLVPPDKRAYGARDSEFKGETQQTNPKLPSSVNNFAYHVSLENPNLEKWYTPEQYKSLAWLLAQSGVPKERITTHQGVDRHQGKVDPEGFVWKTFEKYYDDFRSAIPAKPSVIRNTYADGTTRTTKGNNSGNNYGYDELAKDTAFTKKVHEVSNRLGIPAHWLVDIMNNESAQFNPKHINGSGHGGLIGFGEAWASDNGTTVQRILSMSRTSQMELVYKYLAPYKDRLKSVAHVAAVIFGGKGLLDKYEANPSEALNIGDGNINLRTYVDRLGRNVGRKYSTPHSRLERMLSGVHRGITPGCRVCEMLALNNTFTPHEPNYG